jgi:hypothetical protein
MEADVSGATKSKWRERRPSRLWNPHAFVLYFSSSSGDFLPAEAVLKLPPHGFLVIAGRVAQLAEHSTLNRQVVGSIPTASTKYPHQKGKKTPGKSARVLKLH